MRYITGIHALNLNCALETTGDWHQSALRWEDITFLDSKDSVFGDWGIELGKIIPEHEEEFAVANHIRACFDLLEMGNFAVAQGMRDELICNDKYTPLVFEKVMLLRDKSNWSEISEFMGKEYKVEWLDFIGFKEVTEDMFDFGNKDWRKPHYDLIIKFMQLLGEYNNPRSGFVLKGGTALMLCYGLSRFSEDIDLDGYMLGIEEFIPVFTKLVGAHYRTAKDTNLVKRYMIHYDNPYRKKNEEKPLKIEISYRDYGQDNSYLTQVVPVLGIPTGILTYNVQELLETKLEAFINRDRIRDLYDVVFLGLNYLNKFDKNAQRRLRNALIQRGLEHFDYMVKTQVDEFINSKELEMGLLELWQKLGLL